MNASNVSTRKPKNWFPAVSRPAMPPIVDATTSLVGKLMELGYATFTRNMERDLSSLQSLAQVRDLSSLVAQQRKYMRDFWRDQEETLEAAAKLVWEEFDRALTTGNPPEAAAARPAEQSKATAVKAAKAEPIQIASVREEPGPKASAASAVFEIYLDKANEFRFRLKGSDGTVLLSSEGYTSRSSAVKGIASVKKNANNDARYDKQASPTGKPAFNLKAGNHQVIGSSRTFASTEQMEAAIEIIKQTAASSAVDDQTRAA